MNTIKKTLLTGVITFLAACEQPADQKQLFLEQQLDSFILPLHQQLSLQSQHFINQSTQFCQQPNQQHLQQVQLQWLATMKAWQQVQSINFGPITDDNQAWKMQFWPDKKNLIKQKTVKLLRSEDTINVDKIEQSSVVIQGLSAAEYLLFDQQQLVEQQTILSSFDDNSRNAQRRCQMLTAISQHSFNVAEFLQQQWGSSTQGYGAVFINPNSDNLEFASQNESIASLIQSIVSSLEVIQKNKLGGPLGYNNKKSIPRPYLAEAWRSQQSLLLIAANLSAVERFLTDQNAGLFQLMADNTQAKTLIPALQQKLKATKQALNDIDQPLFTAVTHEASKSQVETLYKQNQSLLRLIKHDVVTSLGLTLGFNANDGD
ncbi:hypothetical protein SIN8267_00437 [Sinobacterium norvegicum]|uniref:Imelysin-like domain-containing protein n=1 Tax=Sinobacterium norvegicum TaxID=1641715 RepID=A0ABM9ABJ4_9GAMM|nr:imelysin family protein [Sinobacterium norvegicum]CAH0990345.1 hypothetical protein SIN8267_00437 [Sinobacterium norvegicum]